MKKVWIINHYAGLMYEDNGGRHYWFADNLRKMGYDPVIFCCNTKHGANKNYFDIESDYFIKQEPNISVPFVFVQSTNYVGNGFDRYKNMFFFYKNVKKTAKKYADEFGNPDVILASSVHPLTMVAGIQLARFFNVKCVCEVRDLWPEEIVAYSDKWKDDDLLIRLLYRGEKWIYQKADDVIFLQEGAYDYIKEKGWEKSIPQEKVHYINNGVDLEEFDRNCRDCIYEDSDLDNQNYINVVYTGSIRRANNLGVMLDVAKEINNPNVRFLIWGDGDQLSELKERCLTEKIGNVVFKGRVEKKYIPGITSRASINLLHWAMSRDLKYGPSFNKMFEYLAAGKPILTTLQTPYSIIVKNDCGYATEDNSESKISEQINAMLALPKERLEEMGRNAREAAKEYDFCRLTEQLVKVLEK